MLTNTLATAGALGILYLVLTFRVIRGRFLHRVSLGDGGQGDMQRRIRAHGNFGEYMPLSLILMALIESATGSSMLLASVGAALVLSRLLHAKGIAIPKAPNPYRFLGGLITYLWIFGASIWALLLAFR